MSELKESNTPKPRGKKITGRMTVIELAVWMTAGLVWGAFANQVLGLFFPWPSIIFVIVYFAWAYSPWGDKNRDWLWKKLYG